MKQMLLVIRVTFIFVITLTLTNCTTSTGPAPVYSISNVKKPIYPLKLTGNTYTVKKGDTLYSVAFSAGITASELSKINNIAPPYVIYVGNTLKLNNKKTYNKVVKQTKVSKKLDRQNKHKYSKTKVNKKQTTKRPSVVKKVNIPTSKKSKVVNKVSKWIWPTKGRVISKYSAVKQGNKGIDIVGLKGSDIVASAAGKVVYAGNALRGYGNLIIIKHNDDYLSAYAHNETIFVKEKQRITQGQLIAKMGNSESNRVQLHFEIRFRGKSVNPVSYLPKR